MTLTTDPNHPDLGHGSDDEKVPQNKAYLILSEEERAKGFIRPVRTAYRHVGLKLEFPTRPLTEEEKKEHAAWNYVLYEIYPESKSPLTGKYWTQAELDRRGGCGTVTKMARELAETYARDPHFYGATYCVGCSKHLPVREFVWDDDGTVVGS